MKIKNIFYSGLALAVLTTSSISVTGKQPLTAQAKVKHTVKLIKFYKYHKKTYVHGHAGFIYKTAHLTHPEYKLSQFKNKIFRLRGIAQVRLANGKIIYTVLISGNGVRGYAPIKKLFIYKKSANNPKATGQNNLSNTNSNDPNGITDNSIANGIPHANTIIAALTQINAERSQRNLAPLTLNSKLMAVANTRAQQLATSFSHYDSNNNAIYEGLINNANMQLSTEAENIGMVGDTSKTLTQNVLSDIHSMMYDDAASNWGHRDNFLNPANSIIGIGVYKDNKGYDYMAYDLGGR